MIEREREVRRVSLDAYECATNTSLIINNKIIYKYNYYINKFNKYNIFDFPKKADGRPRKPVLASTAT